MFSRDQNAMSGGCGEVLWGIIGQKCVRTQLHILKFRKLSVFVVMPHIRGSEAV
jgi:hypothetical protein